MKVRQNLGKGTIFHIAPSNVPINFAFSLISGILMGNSNMVRLPSNQFKQINIIVDAFNRLCKKKDIKIFFTEICWFDTSMIQRQIKYFL